MISGAYAIPCKDGPLLFAFASTGSVQLSEMASVRSRGSVFPHVWWPFALKGRGTFPTNAQGGTQPTKSHLHLCRNPTKEVGPVAHVAFSCTNHRI